MMRHMIKTRVLAFVLVLLAAMPNSVGAAQQGPELTNPGSVTGISKQQQEQIVLQAMGEVYKQMPVLPDSSAQTQYIQRIGRKLAATIPQEYNWPYQFHVIPQKEINAFALPGGPLFINVGTITAADNEAELVGVIAHEMSHIYMQHSMKQASKQSMAQGILGALGSVLGQGTLGTVARAGISIGAGTIFLKYSRNDEAQADAVGAIIAYKAGYNPKAMADFFVKLEQQGGGGGPQFLSDHPNPGNWQAAGDPNSGIAIAPPAGVSQGNVAYGVIINAAQDQNASSLDQAMQNLIQGMQQSNPGLHTKSNPKNISVNGIQGRSVD